MVNSKLLDKLYIAFVVSLLFGIVVFDVMHWPLWPKNWYFQFGHDLEQWSIRNYNDPIAARLPIPNGWVTGVYFFEQLQRPFSFSISYLPKVLNSFLAALGSHKANK